MTTKQKASIDTTAESEAATVASSGSAASRGAAATGTFAGKVLWFDNRKGYGFIQRDDGGDDVFVHFSGIRQAGYRTLRECERVTFELSESAVRLGRMHAVNVQVQR